MLAAPLDAGSICDIPHHWARLSPTALWGQGVRTTHAQLPAQISAAAELLRTRGVRRGDRVLIVAEKCAAALVLFFAAAELTAANHRQRTMSEREIEVIRSHGEPRIQLYTSAVSVDALTGFRSSLILLEGNPRWRRSSRHLYREGSGRVHPITFDIECTGRPTYPITIRPLLHNSKMQRAMASSRTTGKGKQTRSQVTRTKLLEAAIECIAEYGYIGATMDRIVTKAVLSRGAQGHHFPTKSLLVQAAFTHMLDGLITDLRRQTELIRARKSKPSAVFRHLWDEYFSGRLFAVTIELIVASRTDDELRTVLTPVTERFHEQIDDCFYILNRGSEFEDRQIRIAVNLTMSLLRGMGLQTVLFNRPQHFRELLDSWFSILQNILGPESSVEN